MLLDKLNIKTQGNMEEDSDDSGDKPTKRNGRRKINIEYIQDKNRRHITFSKRKAGIMKKAYELSTLTGTQVLLLVVSETGLVYTFTTPKLQPIVTKPEGKNLIQSCLNTPDPEETTTEKEEPAKPSSSSPKDNSPKPNTVNVTQYSEHKSTMPYNLNYTGSNYSHYGQTPFFSPQSSPYPTNTHYWSTTNNKKD
ncbi:unnamed protein product [Rhizopus stolonifer]